jgi:hypothetical protein
MGRKSERSVRRVTTKTGVGGICGLKLQRRGQDLAVLVGTRGIGRNGAKRKKTADRTISRRSKSGLQLSNRYVALWRRLQQTRTRSKDP